MAAWLFTLFVFSFFSVSASLEALFSRSPLFLTADSTKKAERV